MFNDSLNREIREFDQIYPNITHNREDEEINKYSQLFKKPINTSNFIEFNKSLLHPIHYDSRKTLTINHLKSEIKRSFSEKFINKNILSKNFSQIQFDDKTFEKEKNNILLLSNNNSSNYDEDENESDFYYLIKKGIFLQNNKIKRTEDVKKALKLFLINSKIIKKISNYLMLNESRKNNLKTLISKK